MSHWIYLPYILIAATGVIPGHLIHELSHWVVGKIAGSKPKFAGIEIMGRTIWPRGVRHRELDNVSDRIIRISGAVPLFWLNVFLLLVILGILLRGIQSFIPAYVQILAVTSPLAAAVEMTESDVVALMDPKQYRIDSEKDALSRKWGWPIFLRRIIG